jgi:hypothetical protein
LALVARFSVVGAALPEIPKSMVAMLRMLVDERTRALVRVIVEDQACVESRIKLFYAATLSQQQLVCFHKNSVEES